MYSLKYVPSFYLLVILYLLICSLTGCDRQPPGSLYEPTIPEASSCIPEESQTQPYEMPATAEDRSDIHRLPDTRSNAVIDGYKKGTIYLDRSVRGFELGVDEDDESYARQFLDYLMEGDYSAVALHILASNPISYRFIEDAVFGGYEIIDADVKDYYRGFTVKINVSCSDTAAFPIGESFWRLMISRGEDWCICCFEKIELNSKPIYVVWDDLDEEYQFAYMFSHHLGIYSTCEDFTHELNGLLSTDNYLHYMLHYYAAARYQNERFGKSKYITGVSATDPGGASAIKVFFENLAGISGVDYSQYRKEEEFFKYNAVTDSLPPCAHGGSGTVWRPVITMYDDTNKQATTILNYYSDMARFVIARTIAYVYSVNDDGTYTMLRTELLYDSGDEIVIVP